MGRTTAENKSLTKEKRQFFFSLFDGEDGKTQTSKGWRWNHAYRQLDLGHSKFLV
jgi:hypothetical protein